MGQIAKTRAGGVDIAGEPIKASPAQPYVGPRPFSELDSGFFFGREQEASDIRALIFAHQALLLYSQSGAGKSSLLGAEVIPKLSEEGCDVLPKARVKGDVRPEDRSDTFNLNILASIAPKDLAGETFKSNLSDARKVVLDYLAKDRPADKKAISQESIAENILEELGTLGRFLVSLPYPTSTSTASGRLAPRVLILDQFEEMFNAYPGLWPHRRAFFRSIGLALDIDSRLRVVFAMREEFIGNLDPYVRYLPEKLRTRFRLERLDERAAIAAIERPLDATNCRYEHGAAQALADKLLMVGRGEDDEILRDQYVEPLHLQVVCTNIWNTPRPDPKRISLEDIEAIGDVDKAIEEFFDETIVKVAVTCEIPEGKLRRVFNDVFITEMDTRKLALQEGDAVGDLPLPVVAELTRLYLVRAEPRAGAIWFELTHDRLVKPAIKTFEEWRKKNVPDTIRVLEERAGKWDHAGHPEDLLVGASDIANFANWTASPEGRLSGTSDELGDLIRRSKTAVDLQEKTAVVRRRGLQIAASVAIAALSGIVAVLVAVAWRKADDALNATEVATSKTLGQVSLNLSSDSQNLYKSLIYGIEAVAYRHSSPEAVKGLNSALAAIDANASVIHLDDSHGTSYSATLSGDLIAIGRTNGQVRLIQHIASRGFHELNPVTVSDRMSFLELSSSGKWLTEWSRSEARKKRRDNSLGEDEVVCFLYSLSKTDSTSLEPYQYLLDSASKARIDLAKVGMRGVVISPDEKSAVIATQSKTYYADLKSHESTEIPISNWINCQFSTNSKYIGAVSSQSALALTLASGHIVGRRSWDLHQFLKKTTASSPDVRILRVTNYGGYLILSQGYGYSSLTVFLNGNDEIEIRGDLLASAVGSNEIEGECSPLFEETDSKLTVRLIGESHLPTSIASQTLDLTTGKVLDSIQTRVFAYTNDKPYFKNGGGTSSSFSSGANLALYTQSADSDDPDVNTTSTVLMQLGGTTPRATTLKLLSRHPNVILSSQVIGIAEGECLRLWDIDRLPIVTRKVTDGKTELTEACSMVTGNKDLPVEVHQACSEK